MASNRPLPLRSHQRDTRLLSNFNGLAYCQHTAQQPSQQASISTQQNAQLQEHNDDNNDDISSVAVADKDLDITRPSSSDEESESHIGEHQPLIIVQLQRLQPILPILRLHLQLRQPPPKIFRRSPYLFTRRQECAL
jgi:hypothetical protein